MIATLYPDRIVVRPRPEKKTIQQVWENRMASSRSIQHLNLSKKKHNFSLSSQSKKKLKDSANLLSSLSPPRTVYVNQKPIYNFQASFITLTLPSEQIHSDLEIKGCLNNFLTSLRSVYGLRNYVWKAELQQNENIHFHLIFDIPIHYKAIRHYWNKSIETLGYVSRYQAEFSKLDIDSYAKKRGKNKKEVTKAFLEGCRNNWSSPPTENVQSLTSSGAVSYYLSKYVTKDFSKKTNLTTEDNERISKFGRVWARSQSLSKIRYTTRYKWSDLENFILSCDKKMKNVTQVNFDYCTILYFNFRVMSKQFKRWIAKKMYELGITYLYPFPSAPPF